MARPLLLVADNDPHSLGALEAALRKAQLDVVTAADGPGARALFTRRPSLVLCDVALGGADGYAIARAVREDPALKDVPVLLMGTDRSKDARALATSAGADALLGKPLVLGELVARVQQLLGHEPPRAVAMDSSSGFRGEVGELGLVDLFQSLEQWRKHARVTCASPDGRTARVWVQDGRVLDAEVRPLTGEAAFYRLLTWEKGAFQVEFGPVDVEPRIGVSTEGLVLEAMRRVDELRRSSGELPPSARYSIDVPALAEALAILPDEANGVVRLFDGRRSLQQVLEVSPLGDLETLELVRTLLAQHVLRGEAHARNVAAAKAAPPPPPPEDAALEAAGQPHDTGVTESQALVLVRYPPLRGARKERLRREAAEAQTRAEAGLPPVVRRTASHAEPPAGPPRRVISPAVGDAARRFAPDLPVPRLTPAPTPVPPIAHAASRLPPRRTMLLAALLALLLVAGALAFRLWRGRGGSGPVAASTLVRAPDSFADELARGDADVRRGAFREAAAAYRRALAQKSDSPAALTGLGDALLEAGETGAAVSTLREAVHLAPRSAKAQLLLGKACRAAGRTSEASAALARVVELDPQGPLAAEARSLLAHLSR